MLNGQSFDTVKINYLNRTWERFTYESVLHKLLDKEDSLSETEKKLANKKIRAL